MNYKKIYKSLMERAKSQNRTRGCGVYYEKHHIIPDFMFKNRKRSGTKGHLEGDPDDPKNIVLLTAREHIIAHALLAKSLTGQQYWAQAASALNFFFTKVIGEHPRQKHLITGASRKYEMFRQMGIAGISAARTGKMPVVDSITRTIIGSVPVDHPKVLSGEWCHHSKGTKSSDIARQRISNVTKGENNPRYMNITNEEIIETYSWLIRATGQFVSRPFYRKWYKLNFGKDLPNLTSKHRFNFGKDLYGILENATGFKHNFAKTSLNLKVENYPYVKNS